MCLARGLTVLRITVQAGYLPLDQKVTMIRPYGLICPDHTLYSFIHDKYPLL
jgi:hypothetical protein